MKLGGIIASLLTLETRPKLTTDEIAAAGIFIV
jgi:hypothetical protein